MTDTKQAAKALREALENYALSLEVEAVMKGALDRLEELENPWRPMSEAPRYYIQSRKHGFVGNSVIWWAPDSRGYTTEIEDAGLYSEDEAREICEHPCSENRAFLASAVWGIAKHHIWADWLNSIEPLPPIPTKGGDGE